ncbi:hypothetical protein MHH33_05180 [Paenisporosarcina sp. FSL H8-0542]
MNVLFFLMGIIGMILGIVFDAHVTKKAKEEAILKFASYIEM